MTDYDNHPDRDGAERKRASEAEHADDAMLAGLLLRFGGDYNRAPDIVPREEMWHAIGQQKTSRTAFKGRFAAWGMLAAAVLLFGVGISVGLDVRSHTVRAPGAVATLPAESGTSAPDAQFAAGGVDAHASPLRTSTPGVPLQSGRSSSAMHGATISADGGATVREQDARTAAYQLATVRHFTAVEALLTSFQASSHDSRGDAQMAAWARALLSQTRLLLDSPAASDPARRKLLQDLELVLVQMTLLSPSDTPIDRAMINGSVRNNDVITRLRTAVPAGATHL